MLLLAKRLHLTDWSFTPRVYCEIHKEGVLGLVKHQRLKKLLPSTPKYPQCCLWRHHARLKMSAHIIHFPIFASPCNIQMIVWRDFHLSCALRCGAVYDFLINIYWLWDFQRLYRVIQSCNGLVGNILCVPFCSMAVKHIPEAAPVIAVGRTCRNARLIELGPPKTQPLCTSSKWHKLGSHADAGVLAKCYKFSNIAHWSSGSNL